MPVVGIPRAVRSLGLVACVAAALALPGSRAHASNEDHFFVGNRAAMTAGAVTATVADGSAGFYNHAGLAAVERDRFDVSGAAYALRMYSVPDFLSVRGGPSTDASVVEFVAIPTEISYVRKLDYGVSLGLGYFVPRAEDALLREQLTVDEAGADPGSQWALDVRATTSSYWLVAALGVRLSEHIRLGFGLFGVYDTSVESTTLFGGVIRDGATESAVEVTSLGSSSRLGSAPGLGLQVDLSRELALGLWARGPRLQLVSESEASINSVAGAQGAGIEPQLDGFSDVVDDGGEQVGFVSLGRYHVGLAYRLNDTQLSLGVDIQPALHSKRTGVERALTVNARAGVSHALSEDLLLGAGLFSDRATEPDGSGANFYGGTLGIELDDVLGLRDDERADSLVLTTVFALRYAYGRGSATSLIVDPEEDLGTLIGDGRSVQTVHEFGLHVGSALQL